MTSPAACVIDGLGPLPVVRPASVAELAEIVRLAAQAEGPPSALYPLGGQTQLHIGALGTLGIISQVTLKVRPRPETSALLALGCPAGLEALLDQVHQTRTRPVCVEVLNARAARALSDQWGVALPDAPWVVVIG